MTRWLGPAAAVLVAVAILGPLVAIVGRAAEGVSLGPADGPVIRFTVVQALASAGISVLLAMPLARTLARRRFAGRRAIVTLLGAPFILPVIVAVLALLEVFGRAGLINAVLASLGLPGIGIYGLHGVVLAHVFFNLPLATRLLLQAWQEIPAERFRIAAQLGFGPLAMFRVFELPLLVRVVPGIFAVVFTICLSSFAVALMLGGGPRATTLELAIYQAFRFEFDLGHAAALAMVQLAVTCVAALLALRLSRGGAFGPGQDAALLRWDARNTLARVQDGVVIGAAMTFLLVPLAMLVVGGAGGMAALDPGVFRAAVVSLGVALTSSALTIALALPMALAVARHKRGWIELAGFLGLAVSPLVLGTGAYILLFPVVDPAALALPVTAAVNAAMALPFALRTLIPAARDLEADYAPLMASLAMPPASRLRLVVWPRLRPQLGFAAGLSAALSMGDLGVIALFAAPDQATLPLQMYRLMGAYRMDDAAAAAVLLLLLSLGLFWVFDRGGRGHAEA